MSKRLKDQSWFNEKECVYHNFPIDGVDFIDLFPVIENDKFFGLPPIAEDLVLCPESRGFLFLEKVGKNKFIPLRKKGKLPGRTMSLSYNKEYGKDSLEISLEHLEQKIKKFKTRCPGVRVINVAIFDDVLATGGTAVALINMLNGLTVEGVTMQVRKCYFYIEIEALKGRDRINKNFCEVESVFVY